MRFAILVGILAATVGIFAYLGGWLTPNPRTPAGFVKAFEEVGGVHPSFRRNHAKGLGVTGHFESNGNGVRLSKAAVFRAGKFPVLGRFSFGGTDPYVPDSANFVRGLGLEFTAPDGELWRTAMVNLPVFPFRTAEAFFDNLMASKPDPATGKPDPARMKAFLDAHPETVQALTIVKAEPHAAGFADTTFHGLNAFRFVNEAGVSVPVRWILTPLQSAEPVAGAAPTDKSFLFDALIAQIHRQPLKWRLSVIVGQPGDPTADATLPWPASREQVDVGTVTLDRAEAEATSAATEINFDPLILPAGIVPSDDPMLSARSAIYSQDYTKRTGEPKQPSAITPAEVKKGE
jgi:catalase